MTNEIIDQRNQVAKETVKTISGALLLSFLFLVGSYVVVQILTKLLGEII